MTTAPLTFRQTGTYPDDSIQARGDDGLDYRLIELLTGWAVAVLARDATGDTVRLRLSVCFPKRKDAERAAQDMHRHHLDVVRRVRLFDGGTPHELMRDVRLVTPQGDAVTAWSNNDACVFVGDGELVYVPRTDAPLPVTLGVLLPGQDEAQQITFTPKPTPAPAPAPVPRVRRDTTLGYLSVRALHPKGNEREVWLFEGQCEQAPFMVHVARATDGDLTVRVHVTGDDTTRVRTETIVTPVIVTEYATMRDANILPNLEE